MKIIHEGKRRREYWEGQWKCADCKTVIELDRGDKDVVRKYHPAQDARDDTYITLECYICEKVSAFYEVK